MSVVHAVGPHGFLWSGLDFPEWLLAVTAQVIVGFLLGTVVLGSVWALATERVRDWLNPLKPSGIHLPGR